MAVGVMMVGLVTVGLVTVGVMAVCLVTVGIVTPLKNKLDIRRYNAVAYYLVEIPLPNSLLSQV